MIKATSAEAPAKLVPLDNPARLITINRLQADDQGEGALVEEEISPSIPSDMDPEAETEDTAPRRRSLHQELRDDPQFFEKLTDQQRRELFDRRKPTEYGIANSRLSPDEKQPENIAANLFAQEPAEHSAFGYQRDWYPSMALWESPAMFHRPLYFEEVNLERYGHRHAFLQPGLSAAHFVGNAIALPYKIGVNHPCERIYTLGHYRPGDCNPHNVHGLPWSWRGAAYTGAFYTGAVFVLP
ncbi:MAG: hypothetical protein WD045_02545 [Pirellulaceae bacterium]